jgi:hypothetical protein
VLQAVVYTIIAGFGLVMLYVGLGEAVAQRRALRSAVPVEATVVSSGVRESRSSDTDHRPLRDNSTSSFLPEVKFRYAVGGKAYESDLLRPTVIVRGYASREGAAEAVRPFAVGSAVTAWVDPAAPERAFLIRESSVGPVVFIILGLLLPPLGWLASRIV